MIRLAKDDEADDEGSKPQRDRNKAADARLGAGKFDIGAQQDRYDP